MFFFLSNFSVTNFINDHGTSTPDQIFPVTPDLVNCTVLTHYLFSQIKQTCWGKVERKCRKEAGELWYGGDQEVMWLVREENYMGEANHEDLMVHEEVICWRTAIHGKAR